MCSAGPVAGVREKTSESHAAERRDAPTTRNGGSRHLDLKSINSIFTSYVFVIISECIILCVGVYYLCGPNKKNIVSISVGIVVCRSIWNSSLVVARSWLLPHRDSSRKPWRGSISIGVTEKQ